MSKYEEFLVRNNLKKDYMESKVLELILLNVFERLCKYLNEEDNLKTFKNKLRRIDTTFEEMLEYRRIIEKLISIKLTDEEINYIRKLIIAFLDRTDKRYIMSKGERMKITESQNFKCNYCGEDISGASVIDHIIAFKYTGDELHDNYQALCSDCNKSKSDTLYYFFDIILNKRR